jgi:DNA-binding HxlR family transcriptional regulator
MTTRTYNQLCGLAFALDVVGERWTMLIIRELAGGPQRFTDLLVGLPGISTNLLTERLKSLEQHGVITRRTLPPPAASTVYLLTERGRGLLPALLEFGKWGSQFVGEADADCQMLHLGSYVLTPQTFFRPALAQGLDKTYALYIGDEMQTVRIVNGTINVRQGEPVDPDMALHTEIPIYLGLLTRQIDPHAALTAGMVCVDGDVAELFRYVELCGMPINE